MTAQGGYFQAKTVTAQQRIYLCSVPPKRIGTALVIYRFSSTSPPPPTPRAAVWKQSEMGGEEGQGQEVQEGQGQGTPGWVTDTLPQARHQSAQLQDTNQPHPK